MLHVNLVTSSDLQSYCQCVCFWLAMNKDQWDPEFLKAIPIMKTRSGMQVRAASTVSTVCMEIDIWKSGIHLHSCVVAVCPQFSCASPSHSCPDTGCEVWVCNSDGYVGQVRKCCGPQLLVAVSSVKKTVTLFHMLSEETLAMYLVPWWFLWLPAGVSVKHQRRAHSGGLYRRVLGKDHMHCCSTGTQREVSTLTGWMFQPVFQCPPPAL